MSTTLPIKKGPVDFLKTKLCNYRTH